MHHTVTAWITWTRTIRICCGPQQQSTAASQIYCAHNLSLRWIHIVVQKPNSHNTSPMLKRPRKTISLLFWLPARRWRRLRLGQRPRWRVVMHRVPVRACPDHQTNKSYHLSERKLKKNQT